MITEEQKIRAKQIYDNIRSNYDSKMEELRSDWHDFYKNYRGILTQDKYKGSANLFIMETHNAVETLVSRIRRLVLSTDPPFDLEYEGMAPNPELRDFFKRTADTVKAKIAQQFRNAAFSKHLDMFLRTMCIYGTGIMKYSWEYKEHTVYKNGKPEKVVDYDDVFFEEKDPFNIYLLGSADTVEELDGVMERIETTVAELKLNERKKVKGQETGIYENLDEIQPTTLGDNVEYNRKGYRKYDLRVSPNEIDKDAKPVELFELWCDFDYEGDGVSVPCVISVANGVVIRVQRNPFFHQKKPYIICPFIPVPQEPWGIGVAELIINDQAHINDTFNQMCDDASFTLHNMWTRNVGCPTLKSQLRAAPNKVFDVRSPDDLRPIPSASGQIMSTGIQVVRLIRDNIANTTGAQPILQGQPLRSRTTATEAQGQERQGMAKIIDISDRVSERVIKKCVEMTFELDRQFMVDGGMVKIETPEGDSFEKVLLTSFDFDYAFNVIGAMDVENKMVRQQQLIGFLNILRGFPPAAVASPIFNLLRRIWESFGYKDFEQVIPPDVENQFKQMVGAPTAQAGQMGERMGSPGEGNTEAGMMGAMLGQGQMPPGM